MAQVKRKSRRRLRGNTHSPLRRVINDIAAYTPFTVMIGLLVLLWLLFSTGVYLAEQTAQQPVLANYGEALYWAVAAFSTAGIADTPASGWAQLIGGIWIVVGSMLFFGTIVATVTGYFMRPLQRPHKKIIETIEVNLEQLDDLNLDELGLLKETVDALIEHMEVLNQRQQPKSSPDSN